MKLEINSDFPCRCGHLKDKHQYGGESNACWECIYFKSNYDYWHEFITDNLKYLEQKAIEKGNLKNEPL